MVFNPWMFSASMLSLSSEVLVGTGWHSVHSPAKFKQTFPSYYSIRPGGGNRMSRHISLTESVPSFSSCFKIVPLLS